METDLTGRVLSTLRTQLAGMQLTLTGLLAEEDGHDRLCDLLLDAGAALDGARRALQQILDA